MAGKNKCIYVVQESVYVEKKCSCIVYPLGLFAFRFRSAVRKGKEKLSNKDWNGGMLCGIIESGTIKYRWAGMWDFLIANQHPNFEN